VTVGEADLAVLASKPERQVKISNGRMVKRGQLREAVEVGHGQYVEGQLGQTGECQDGRVCEISPVVFEEKPAGEKSRRGSGERLG